jgi:hypothetical protein
MDIDFGLIQFNGALVEINAYNLNCDELGWAHTSFIEYVYTTPVRNKPY